VKKAVLSVELSIGPSFTAAWCNAKSIDNLGCTPDTRHNGGKPKETVHIIGDTRTDPMHVICGKYTINTVYSLGGYQLWDGAVARSMTTSVERHGVLSRRSIINITLVNICAACFDKSDAKLRLKVGSVGTGAFTEDSMILNPGDDLSLWKEHGLYVK